MTTASAPQNVRMLQPGEFLCMQGEPSNEIFVLRSGKIHALVNDAGGLVAADQVEAEGMLVGEIDQPGSFIGEIGAILREPRSASLRAVEQSQVMVINLRGEGFQQNIMANPKLGFNLARSIAMRLGSTTNSLTTGDALSSKVRDMIDHYTASFFTAFDSTAVAAAKNGKELPLLKEAQDSLTFQIGKLSKKYEGVPMELYSSLNLPFSFLPEYFRNRIFLVAPGVKFVEVAGPPKPGVNAFAPGEIVCAPKTVDSTMYILLAGRLEVFVGNRVIDVIQEHGSIFGEMALFGDWERSSGIRAVTDVHAMSIPAQSVEAFLMKKPQLLLHVLRCFAKQLPRLNRAILNTAHQTTQLMDLLGHSANGCITAYEMFAPRLKAEGGAVGDEALQAAAALENDAQELQSNFEGMNNKYLELCQAIGYKPRTLDEGARPTFSVPLDGMQFVTKIDELPNLDAEHVNFVFNPKKDLFRAAPIEMPHDALIQRAKISQDMVKDLVFGRIHNLGERFPTQFVSFDMNSMGYGAKTREDVIRTLTYIVGLTEQEVAIDYSGAAAVETIFIPDHIKAEGDELVDEATIQEFIAKFAKDPSDREALEKLNALYWDLVINTVLKKLPKVKDQVIPFEDADLKLINYGLIDPKFLPDNSSVLEQIEADRTFSQEGIDLKFIYLTDHLQAIYKKAFGFNKLKGLEDIYKGSEQKLKAARERLVFLTRERVNLINSFPGGNAAVPFVQKMDKMMQDMSILDRKMKMGRQLTPDERNRIGLMKGELVNLNNQLTRFLTALKGKVSEDKIAEFRNMGTDLANQAIEQLKMEEELALRKQDVDNHIKEMNATTMKMRETTYKNEVIRLKKYVTLTARKSQVDPVAVLTNVRDIATKTRVKEVLDLFMSDVVDPQIFDPSLPRVKKDGPPRIMLLPGSGVSVYDWEQHMFLVPLIAGKTLEESVANAFVEFHWDMDEDHAMRESFGQIKIYKKLSVTALKLQLAKDYVVWATKESKNWKVLDKEVRAWFLTRIAKQKVKTD